VRQDSQDTKQKPGDRQLVTWKAEKEEKAGTEAEAQAIWLTKPTKAFVER